MLPVDLVVLLTNVPPRLLRSCPLKPGCYFYRSQSQELVGVPPQISQSDLVQLVQEFRPRSPPTPVRELPPRLHLRQRRQPGG